MDLDAGEGAAADPVKRIRNLKKKLTQIQQLKERLQNGTLKSLDQEQQAKLDSEPGILGEIKSLERT